MREYWETLLSFLRKRCSDADIPPHELKAELASLRAEIVDFVEGSDYDAYSEEVEFGVLGLSRITDLISNLSGEAPQPYIHVDIETGAADERLPERKESSELLKAAEEHLLRAIEFNQSENPSPA